MNERKKVKAIKYGKIVMEWLLRIGPKYWPAKKIGVFFFQKKRKCSEGKTPSYLKVDVIHEGFHFLLDCKI
jgi:hypothetical protein